MYHYAYIELAHAIAQGHQHKQALEMRREITHFAPIKHVDAYHYEHDKHHLSGKNEKTHKAIAGILLMNHIL